MITEPQIPPLPDGFIPAEFEDPAEVMIGPFFKHTDEPRTLLWTQEKHTNLAGVIHGGVLMTFVDFTLCSAVMRNPDCDSCITLNASCNFTDNVTPGHWIEGRCEITRQSARLVFATGQLLADNRTLVTFSGLLRPTRNQHD